MTTQTRKGRNRQKRQYWQTEVEKWQESGMSQVEYCRRQGVKVKCLSYWLRKFRKEKVAGIKFVEIPNNKIVSCKQEAGRTTELKLIINESFSIEVSNGFAPSTLRQVIETVRQL